MTTVTIGSPEWHAARAKTVGASEVAALFGCQPAYANSHYTLWMVKAGRMPPPEVTGSRPKWGLRIEEAIGAAVAEERGWDVRRADWTPHPDVLGLACSPDFIAWFDGNDYGPLETKNVDWLIHRRQWRGEPPLHIELQLQTQLACLEAKHGAIASLVGGNELKVYEFERRPKIIAEIEQRVTEFWRSIAEGREPPIDGSESTARTVSGLWPDDDGVDVPADLSADNELPGMCQRYLWAAHERKEAEKVEREARSAILDKVRDHRRALCQGFSISAPAIAGKPDSIITPDMVGEEIKGRASSRRLTVKEQT